MHVGAQIWCIYSILHLLRNMLEILRHKLARLCTINVKTFYFSGKPSDLHDRSHPDWAPTLKLTDTATPSETERRRKQAETALKRYNHSPLNFI